MAADPNRDPMASFLAKVKDFETNTKVVQAVGEVFDGAVNDIRHRLVTEAWFGRHIPEAGHQSPADKGSMAEQAGWVLPATTEQKAAAWDALCDKLAKERGHQPQHPQEQDRELDR